MGNSISFQQEQISAALRRTGIGKSLGLLDRATDGSVVALLRDGKTSYGSPTSRAYEFPDEAKVRVFKENLELVSRMSVFMTTCTAEDYNRQFELGAES
jgi:hypothetical protein